MNSDNKIITLKEQIKLKKEKLDSIKKFTPKTNCILNWNDKKINIQVLKKDELILLASMLHSYNMSSKNLGLNLVMSGYDVQDWIDDIKSKLDILTINEERSKLEEMEIKLMELLSNEKKVELEINKIESML
ncbi:TPA: hypothetical protein KR288_002487 [Clostridioides difficile]|uniref:hypothetical protein n=1 Tax=Clostridioides difficile TaxID=1496 RepID=UPI001C14DB4D|nr:hypothetical protein [Clostridioides difficile]MDY6558475.1 hypothetical protein [Clostridioides difficile]MDY6690666.1 hypothetical protein [Clostridioides difficile]HBF0668639.1 hypothetical protein [Clostridioides difficile]HBF4141929.1 hypothetical protein [Clostridioides difficile]HBF4922955.1 hypothetical protein [Clostridioides difficile]